MKLWNLELQTSVEKEIFTLYGYENAETAHKIFFVFNATIRAINKVFCFQNSFNIFGLLYNPKLYIRSALLFDIYAFCNHLSLNLLLFIKVVSILYKLLFANTLYL